MGNRKLCRRKFVQKKNEQIRAIEKQCKVQKKPTNKQINKPKY